MALQMPKEARGLSKDCLFVGPLEKGVLLACYVTRRGDRPEEGEGRSRGWRVKAHNNGPSQVGRAHQLSAFSCNLRKWNLEKLVSS